MLPLLCKTLQNFTLYETKQVCLRKHMRVVALPDAMMHSTMLNRTRKNLVYSVVIHAHVSFASLGHARPCIHSWLKISLHLPSFPA